MVHGNSAERGKALVFMSHTAMVVSGWVLMVAWGICAADFADAALFRVGSLIQSVTVSELTYLETECNCRLQKQLQLCQTNKQISNNNKKKQTNKRKKKGKQF